MLEVHRMVWYNVRTHYFIKMRFNHSWVLHLQMQVFAKQPQAICKN